jgi:hypothetical protein
MPSKIDLTGKRFGRLLVLQEHDRSANHKIRWLCLCDCGRSIVAIGADMVSLHQQSCGCLKRELASKRMAKLSFRHGLSGSYFGRAWKSMRQRCYNAATRDFARWGGRGIRMCDFIRSAPQSLETLLGKRPPGMSIDRRDNNEHYSCGSCSECLSMKWRFNLRWATRFTQMRNTRTNRIVVINGERHCVSEWLEKLGKSKDWLYNQTKRGLSVDSVLNAATL